MGDYMHQKGLRVGERHPAYMALDYLGVTASVLGNHEFNYGLDFLHQSLNTKTPILNANIVDVKTDMLKYRPYVIRSILVLDNDGNAHQLKVGIIGFVPPQIMSWDKKHLENKIRVLDIVQMANFFCATNESTRGGYHCGTQSQRHGVKGRLSVLPRKHHLRA